MKNNKKLILNSGKGFEFKVNDKIWRIPSIKLNKSGKICFIPSNEESNSDSSVELCKILSSLEEQVNGDYHLFGKNILELNYSERLELRKKIGYIQSYGGLFSNRSVSENIIYPLTFNQKSKEKSYEKDLNFLLEEFNLKEFMDLKPHEIDGLTRWRTCAARALITDPDLLIIEGVGDWHYKKDISFFWNYVLEKNMTLAVGLTGKDYIFQEWFSNTLGGKLVNIELERIIVV